LRATRVGRRGARRRSRGREESEGMLRATHLARRVKVNSNPHAACRQNKEVERVRRELELWRAEAQLLGVTF